MNITFHALDYTNSFPELVGIELKLHQTCLSSKIKPCYSHKKSMCSLNNTSKRSRSDDALEVYSWGRNEFGQLGVGDEK